MKGITINKLPTKYKTCTLFRLEYIDLVRIFLKVGQGPKLRSHAKSKVPQSLAFNICIHVHNQNTIVNSSRYIYKMLFSSK